MENKNDKSTMQKASRGAQMLKGAGNIARGIASGNFVAVARGTAEVLSPQVLLIIVLTIVFIILIPVIVIASLPQIMFSWATVDDVDLKARNIHGTEITAYYEEIYEKQPKGLNVDICWLISIESVLHKQKVEDISRKDVEESFRRSYKTDEETGTLVSKTPAEMMDELGFTEADKNWAELMYTTISDQYIPPGSNMADNDLPVSDDTGDVIKPENDDGTPLGESGETVVTYYSQIDDRWENTKYGKSGTIGSAGCGPTALAIVVSTFKGRNITPVEVANWSVRSGHRCEGNGSYHSIIPEGAKHYGLKVEKLGRSSKIEIANHLSSGKLIVAIMGKGHFTNGGHFIVLRGITSDGKVLVADPASRKRSNRTWDMSIILNEAKGTASSGGPFWSLSK